MNRLAETALHDWHTAHHGRMVDFAGWAMPVHYTSIVDEHQATRNAVGLFDISHMGRLEFRGADSEAWLSHLVTRRLDNLDPGQIRYALVTNEQGGVLDDVLVYRLPPAPKPVSSGDDQEGSLEWMLVVNAGNRLKILQWLERHQAEFSSRVDDRTADTAMVAVQGPRAIELVDALFAPSDGSPLQDTAYYEGRYLSWNGQTLWFSRTGYTGEDGCELIVEAAHATTLWEQLLEQGRGLGIDIKPAGLGARDTLRLEAAMPLYGHELEESINPFEAGLGFAVHLKKDAFLGKDALAELKQTVRRRRVGLFIDSKRIPRQHYKLYHADREVGEITSGSFSPTLERPIAMGFVEPEQAEPGTALEVDIRGTRVPAQVVALPFYSRP